MILMHPLLAKVLFFPEQASTIAPKVDAIFWGLLAISTVMTLGLFVVITFFLIRYREASEADRTQTRLSPTYLEVTWTSIPIVIFVLFFQRRIVEGVAGSGLKG